MAALPTALSDQQWDTFCRDGFVNLGRVATDEELSLLNARLDDLSEAQAG